MSDKVTRDPDTRPAHEIESHAHRTRKAIGMAKQQFAYPILSAARSPESREPLRIRIEAFLEGFKDSDNKPVVEDYRAVARELAFLDPFEVKKSDKEISVKDIPRHAKVKSKGVSKDPVERALESERSRKRATMEGATPVLVEKALPTDQSVSGDA